MNSKKFTRPIVSLELSRDASRDLRSPGVSLELSLDASRLRIKGVDVSESITMISVAPDSFGPLKKVAVTSGSSFTRT